MVQALLLLIGMLIMLVAGTAKALAAEDSVPAPIDHEHSQDIIILENGHRFYAKVIQATGRVVTINMPHGEVQLPRALVASIHLGLESRLRLLDENDYEAVLALARWCSERELMDEALDLAQRAWDLEPQQEYRAVLLLARLLDAREGRQLEALTYYRHYRDRGGSDGAVLDRLNELEQHYRSYEEAMQAYQQQTASARENHMEGLEARENWQDDPQYANEVTWEHRTVHHQGVDNIVLAITYHGGSHDKATIRRARTFSIDQHPSLSFLIANPEDAAIAVSLAVKTGPSYTYYESRTVTVSPEEGQWQRIEFDFTSTDWKSEASNWGHSASIGTADDPRSREVRELQIQFHNRNRQGLVLLDAIPPFRSP
ncbi:MAG: hypothetical protein EA401_09095 [Planctomycetota bacterium]|nr:MAG: hypothetical protein EA401_09095 [Planctomycetota bacterium]